MNRAITLLALVLLALPVGLARADGDPASDVLISQGVYYPYSPPVSAGVQRVLTKVTADAKRAGYPIRVALIAGQPDLGSVPTLFNRPPQYAKFLQSEITFNKPRPLLVVMPSGYGWVAAGPKADAVMKEFAAPGPLSDTMARNAASAVAKLAGAAGHPIAAPATGTDSGKAKSSTPWWVFVVPLVLVALGVAALSRRLGRREDEDEDDDVAGEARPAGVE